MGETTDDIRPLGNGGRVDWVTLAKVAAKVIGIVTTAIIAAIVAYQTAISDAQIRAQAAKQLAEDGYQVTRPVVDGHDRRIRELEATVRALSAQQHPPARRGSKPRPLPTPAPVTPTPPKALPKDLDQAQRQILAKPAPLAPRAADAGQ